MLLLAAISLSLGTSFVAWSQDRGGQPTPPRAEPRPEHAPPSKAGTKRGGPPGPPPTHAQSDVVEEGGAKVKVFRFGEFDISGRLKSPQLLYFLNRVRTEFDRPRLPHRTFMPELRRSTHGKAF